MSVPSSPEKPPRLVRSRPPAAAAATLQGTVKIKAIDEETRVVTLVGEKGRIYTLTAGPTIDLSKAKVGMQRGRRGRAGEEEGEVASAIGVAMALGE